jgi:hypothetical protein
MASLSDTGVSAGTAAAATAGTTAALLLLLLLLLLLPMCQAVAHPTTALTFANAY